MQLMPSTNQKSPLLEKILKFAIPAGLIFGGLKLWNALAPTILKAAENFWLFIAMVVPAVALTLMVAFNHKTIWMWFTGFCKKITRWIVAMDPLSIMDGYLIRLRKKSKNLAATLLFLNGKKIELGRIIDKKTEEFTEFTRLAKAAQQQGVTTSAQANAQKALSCKKSVELYTPIFNKYQTSTKNLGEMQETWINTIDTLAYTIEAKREEFKTLKSMYNGLKSIEDLLSNGSPEAQLFAESLKALEADVSQKLAYVEDFEKKAQPLITDMKVKKQADQNDAMALLEELTKDNNLKLPNYQTFVPKVEDIDYIEVKSKYKI